MRPSSPGGSARRAAAWAVRVVLTLALTFFLFRSLRLSWAQIAHLDPVAWRPRPVPLVASFALLLAVFTYLVALWARMVRSLGGPALGVGESMRIFFLANLGRYVPGKVWQLAGLTYLAGKRGVSLPVASCAAVLGQIFSLGAAALMAALALTVAAGTRLPRELLPVALALAALIALLTTVPGALRLLLRVAFWLGRSRQDVPSLDRWFGARWLVIYLPAWVGYGAAFGLLWSGFETLPPVPWLAAVGGFAGAYFLGYAAVFAPAGIGVREGAMAVLLAPWIGAAPATVLSLIARLWMTLAEILPLAGVGWVAAARWLRPKTDTANDER